MPIGGAARAVVITGCCVALGACFGEAPTKPQSRPPLIQRGGATEPNAARSLVLAGPTISLTKGASPSPQAAAAVPVPTRTSQSDFGLQVEVADERASRKIHETCQRLLRDSHHQRGGHGEHEALVGGEKQGETDCFFSSGGSQAETVRRAIDECANAFGIVHCALFDVDGVRMGWVLRFDKETGGR
jgi:hypothetical protein